MRFISLISAVLLYATSVAQTPFELLNKLKKSPKDTSAFDIYDGLYQWYLRSQPDSATYYCFEGIQLAKTLNYKLGEAKMLSRLGTINSQHDNLQLAMRYNREALAIFEQYNSLKDIANIQKNIGIYEGKQGNYDVAVEYFLKSIHTFKQLNDSTGMALNNLNLGLVNFYQGNSKKALEYYSLAEKLNNKTTNNLYYTLLNNIGIVYAQKEQYNKAIEFFEKAVATSDKPTLIDVHISALNNLVKAYIKSGNSKQAKMYFTLVLQKAKQNKMPEEEARAYVNFAEVEAENNNLNEALRYYLLALEITQNIGYKELEASILNDLSIIYESKKNYQAALDATKKFNVIKDSLYNINKTRELSSMLTSHELNESKARVSELEVLNQKRTFERNLILIVVLFVTIILAISWRSYRKIKKINKQLTETNLTKDKLFSIIGHDLRGPIGNTLQVLELLESGALNDEEKTTVIEEVKKHTQHSYTTLIDLLNWGQSQLRGVIINPVTVNTKDSVNDVMGVLNSQARSKSLQLLNNIHDNHLVIADQNHVEFIFRNLISNAIKFSNEGSRIDVNSAVNDHIITFSVKDYGIGISKEKLNQFTSSSNMDVHYGTQGEKGTGLGLLLVKEYVKANKGKIWIESEEGKGTTFYFTFPKA